MALTKEEVELLKKGFQKLEAEYGIEPLEDNIDEDWDTVYFPFPDEEGGIEVETEHLVGYLRELDSIKIHNFNRVTTETITQRVITPSEIKPLFYLGLLHSTTKDEISLQIVIDPILIGIAATKMGKYNEDYPPCSSHYAVEVIYPSKESRLSDGDEEKLIKSFFFELSHTYKIGFTFSSFEKPEEYDLDEVREEIKNLPGSTEDYNPGMDLFVQANQAISDDLKYLIYYKIFEYFAPVYSKIEAFEAMRRKLDSSNASNVSAEYIASIFELSKNYEKSIRDKELVKSVIDKTFDLVDIYLHLPASIRKTIKVEKLEYKHKVEVKDRVINHLGNILYSTRNGIVHAKSNVEPSGNECPEDDLAQLNEFMHRACYSLIKWYNRLPKHLKINSVD